MWSGKKDAQIERFFPFRFIWLDEFHSCMIPIDAL